MSKPNSQPGNGNDWRERMDRVEASFNARMDRIAERHEALAQTVEIIAGMQKESEGRIATLEGHMAKLDGHMAKLTLTMDRLANIVIRHEERLDAIDGGDQ